MTPYPKVWKTIKLFTYISSVRQPLVRDLQLWQLHCTVVGCPFAFQSLALALSVSGSGGAGMSASVSLVDFGTGLHTPILKVMVMYKSKEQELRMKILEKKSLCMWEILCEG